MRKSDFERIKKASELFQFTSLEHSEYNDIVDYKLLQKDDKGIFMVGWNKEKQLDEIHWAANHVENLKTHITEASKPLVITFIPEEWMESLKKDGFEIFGIWNDYFKESIVRAESLPNYETLSEDDAEEISQVTLSCRGASRGFTGQSVSFCRDWIIEHSKSNDSIQNTAIIGYKDEEKLVGCVFVAVYGVKKTLWIREIAVSPAYQGRGIGRHLLRQAFAYGLEWGARRSFLAADEYNENAIHLYQSLGYVGNPKDRQIDMILEN